MKSIAILFSSVMLFATARMCSDKDAEEYQDEQLSSGQSNVEILKEATTNWNKFMVTANKMVAISENNLKSLELKINRDDNVNGNLEWKTIYNKSELQLNQLKEELDCHNEEVRDAIKNSNLSPVQAVSKFPSKFLHDIIELNNEMEDIIDQ